KAAIEADKVAKDIKDRAKREAETYTEDTIARAKEKAREILTAGKKRAQEAKQQEIEALLHTARRTAAITEREVKQQAQLFLIKSKESIEGDLKEEVKEAYEHLLSSLQDLLSQGNDLQVQWKGKAMEPWSGERLDLEYEEVNQILPAESAVEFLPVSDENEALPAVPEEELHEEMEQISDSLPPAETPPEVVEVAIHEGIDAIAEKAEMASHEHTELPAEAHPRDTANLKAMPSQATNLSTYQGEVELIFMPPMEMSAMSEIYSWLQTTPEVKILRTIGSWEKGTRVIVFLERPVPLIDILTRVPSIKVASELFEKKGLQKKVTSAVGAEDKEKGKHRIALKMQHN
ncbi:hypothetical protein ACFLW2_05295, partial [Chloroflexota bacterium]